MGRITIYSTNFFYLVDGRKLEYQGYNPLSYWEVFEDGLQDDHFNNKEMILINCCTCGYWECDCVVAVVTEKISSVMEQMKKVAEERMNAGASWKKEEIEK